MLTNLNILFIIYVISLSAHEAGLAALQVARGGRVVSDTVVFEYKAGPVPTPSSPASAPLPSLDFRRFSLLQRLQRLHGRLQMKIEPMDDNSQVNISISNYL